jgi:hypothetical protein
VIGIARTSANFLRREVGIGSREEDLEGHSLMREDISPADTHSKKEKGGIFLGTSVVEEQEAESRLARMSVTFFRN